ncbi:actin lateral binding protein [Diplodia corticola]|uniref:Actin lateral binding protein n=1 Tax=Diplodia corticola TaxID=236234 RepID=A0A1J9QWQ5_9PEZI|nr:actin lateral binding protein [Diplodia corticola]OJD32426.1 actin lateral binding protein [Diplodia corticola]
MDAIKKRMNALRIEADEATAKVEELSSDKKRLEQENLAKEQEITSLAHRNQLLEGEVEKLETHLKDAKAIADDSSQAGTHNESLTRRVQLLEEEAEEADKNLRETNEKYVTFLTPKRFWFQLRQTDVRAGHYERKVQALEAERDQWEAKYEEMAKKYADTKKELDDFVNEIGNI